ncbi:MULTISPECIES: hypothetical protein [unclassified Sphingosinithalassobacter]|uniref:hypothetical protein n=1 Tax=unclassified Sphingosinithalassobacter TaxID=2676235 RepID=UPI00165DFC32|nr:hypothetical protein [Sphingosinithalassobacter sp. CS137]
MTDRYEGKPFLKLLDSYVLDAIDALDTTAEAALTAIEPQLRDSYGVQGSWREIVVREMQFPEGMQGAIREVWEKGRVRFVQTVGKEPDPVEFARTFVDTNFPR